jgi:antitoxin (DNA-binding transcriptional repressor) of toxin-antitoxin stability system
LSVNTTCAINGWLLLGGQEEKSAAGGHIVTGAHERRTNQGETRDEAQTQLPALLAAVEAMGESVLICHKGKPVADLVPYRMRSRLILHPMMQQLRIHYDSTEPLTADEWPEQSR